MGSVGSGIMERIERAVRELVEMDYPRVWIGEEGITADEVLAIQETNEELPEWMRVEPGEFVGIGGTDAGVRVPEVGINWLDGSWFVRHAPHLPVYGSPVLGGGLQEEVVCIEAAKRGGVVVDTAAVVRYAPEDALTEDDRVTIASAFLVSGEAGAAAMAVVFEGYRTRFVALEDLTPEDVDEDLLETLESLAQEGPGSFVIEDSGWARWALKQRLGEE